MNAGKQREKRERGSGVDTTLNQEESPLFPDLVNTIVSLTSQWKILMKCNEVKLFLYVTLSFADHKF